MVPVMLAAAVILLGSCDKFPVEPVEVYPPAPVPLAKFLDGDPVPAIGNEGSIVTFQVQGLKDKMGQFKFYFNGTEATVLEVGETTIKARVPQNASSGAVSLNVNSQIFFGPIFNVKGKVSVDPLFLTGSYRTGTSGYIRGMIGRTDGNVLAYGSFNDYKVQATEANKITGLAVLNTNGDYLAVASQLKMGKNGFNGAINHIIQMSDGRYLVAGYFSSYDTINNLGGIAILNSDGTISTTTYDVINTDPNSNPDGAKTIGPVLNGGVSGGLLRSFLTTDGKIIAIGNFSVFRSVFYEGSTKDGPLYDNYISRNIVKMGMDGSFDSSFNFNKALNRSFDGANGFVEDAIQLANGKIVLVGSFTTFHGKPAKGIVAIDPVTGLVDESMTFDGGADGRISGITYNATTKKIMVFGSFQNFGGGLTNGVAMLNENGTVDNNFKFKAVTGGYPNYAGQLNNGKVIVSGGFTYYSDAVRNGILILNTDGTAASGYNNMGLFRGRINAIYETAAVLGVPTAILVGQFDKFDNQDVQNIVKIRIEN